MAQITVVPFGLNIIRHLVNDVTRNRRGNLREITVVFPHRRPVAYFYYYLSACLNRPVMPPRAISFEDWISGVFASEDHEYSTYTTIDEFDQAWIAFLAAREVMPDKAEDWSAFFPWSIRIAQAIKELDLELKEPEDMAHPLVGGLPEKAVHILKRIGQIYRRFNEILEEKRLITHSKKLKLLAEGRFPVRGDVLYFAGFFALTAGESSLLKRCYESGARFYWQADPENLPEIYRRWRLDWKIEDEQIEIAGQRELSPALSLFEAHDLHSELAELERRLSAIDRDGISRPDTLGVILPSSGSLIPLLYHLPKAPVNITLGYPLNLTGAYAFFNNLFDLILTKDETRGYFQKKFIRFLRGPYLQGRRGLVLMDKILSDHAAPCIKGEDAIDLCRREIAGTYQEGLTENGMSIHVIEGLFDQVIYPMERAETPADLADAIGVCVSAVCI